jgi:hypothetical protein
MRTINFFIWCIFIPLFMISIPVGAIYLAQKLSKPNEVKQIVEDTYITVFESESLTIRQKQ